MLIYVKQSYVNRLPQGETPLTLFSIRADTDQQRLSELPDQDLLCLIIKKVTI